MLPAKYKEIVKLVGERIKVYNLSVFEAAMVIESNADYFKLIVEDFDEDQFENDCLDASEE